MAGERIGPFATLGACHTLNFTKFFYRSLHGLDVLRPRALRTASLLVGDRLPDAKRLDRRSLQRTVMEEQLSPVSANESKALVRDDLFDRPLRHNTTPSRKNEKTKKPSTLHPEPLGQKRLRPLVEAKDRPQLEMGILAEGSRDANRRVTWNESYWNLSGLTGRLATTTALILADGPSNESTRLQEFSIPGSRSPLVRRRQRTNTRDYGRLGRLGRDCLRPKSERLASRPAIGRDSRPRTGYNGRRIVVRFATALISAVSGTSPLLTVAAWCRLGD